MLLLLGGTHQALRLSAHLSERAVKHLYSLAGVTSSPRIPEHAKVHLGGFGGAQGLSRFIRERNILAILDATHPFAERMSRNACEAASDVNLPLTRWHTPPWQPQKDDNWLLLSTGGDLQNELLKLQGKRVFLAIGQKGTDFALSETCTGYLRLIEKSDKVPAPNTEVLAANPPFTFDEELRLLKRLRIDVLVAKNSGQNSGIAKINAARSLSIPVFMLQPPVLPSAHEISSEEELSSWLAILPDLPH